jgi:hypothetical protein
LISEVHKEEEEKKFLCVCSVRKNKRRKGRDEDSGYVISARRE